eukprot:COSAG01_NODE_3692_length_5789_cov_4.628295_6_plen_174_part_00
MSLCVCGGGNLSELELPCSDGLRATRAPGRRVRAAPRVDAITPLQGGAARRAESPCPKHIGRSAALLSVGRGGFVSWAGGFLSVAQRDLCSPTHPCSHDLKHIVRSAALLSVGQGVFVSCTARPLLTHTPARSLHRGQGPGSRPLRPHSAPGTHRNPPSGSPSAHLLQVREVS